MSGAKQLSRMIRKIAETDTRSIVTYTPTVRARRGESLTDTIVVGPTGSIDSSYAFSDATVPTPVTPT